MRHNPALPSLLFCAFWLQIPAPAQKVFFGNLHSHTGFSDGTGKPSDAFKHAREKAKLDFLMVSEHNHSQAGPLGSNHSLYKGPQAAALIPTAKARTVDGQFIALYGQEFSSISTGNHANVFDIPEVIDAPNGRFDKLLEFLRAHPDSTGQTPFIQFNHPDLTDDESEEYGLDDFPTRAQWLNEMGAVVRLVEIINGPAKTKLSGVRGKVMQADFLRLLNFGFKVAPSADQDNHFKTWGTATDARTAVIAASLTKVNLLDAFRKRHVYATEDKNLRMIFRVNGELCGEVLAAPATGSELDIRFSIQDDDEPKARYKIEVFSDGAPGGQVAKSIDDVAVEGDTASGRIDDITFTGPSQYLFFKVTQFASTDDDEIDRAWTAPVWFSSTGTMALTTAGAEIALASRNSKRYHTSSDCLDAKRIKPANLLKDAEARKGRRIHAECPRLEN